MEQLTNNGGYKWTPEDKFELTGAEFGAIGYLVNAVMQADEVGRVLYALEAQKAVQRLFQLGKEEGKIVENVVSNLVKPKSGLLGPND